MDNTVPNKTNPTTATVNPFLRKHNANPSNIIPQDSIVNQFFSNTAAPSPNPIMSTSNRQASEVDS